MNTIMKHTPLLQSLSAAIEAYLDAVAEQAATIAKQKAEDEWSDRYAALLVYARSLELRLGIAELD
jgi:hypothetical protein